MKKLFYVSFIISVIMAFITSCDLLEEESGGEIFYGGINNPTQDTTLADIFEDPIEDEERTSNETVQNTEGTIAEEHESAEEPISETLETVIAETTEVNNETTGAITENITEEITENITEGTTENLTAQEPEATTESIDTAESTEPESSIEEDTTEALTEETASKETSTEEVTEGETSNILAVFDKFYDKNYKEGTTHSDGGKMNESSDTYISGDYILKFENYKFVYKNARDDKGNPALKLGTGKESAYFEITVPEEVNYVVIRVAKYKDNNAKIIINGTEFVITKSSDDGEYDEIYVNTSSLKTIVFETDALSKRCMISSIEYLSEI